jgi:hypothetical protein
MSVMEKNRRLSKKALALKLYAQGLRVEKIAELLHTDPSYVANALIVQGEAPPYVDLYTSTGQQNRYAERLAGVLRFKDVQAARESIARIDALYHEFEAARDRRGQHQTQLLALTGKNRAEGLGKRAEARIFADWLIEHLRITEDREAAVVTSRLHILEPPREEEAQLPLRIAA